MVMVAESSVRIGERDCSSGGTLNCTGTFNPGRRRSTATSYRLTGYSVFAVAGLYCRGEEGGRVRNGQSWGWIAGVRRTGP
jgi:hypothetical protein